MVKFTQKICSDGAPVLLLDENQLGLSFSVNTYSFKTWSTACKAFIVFPCISINLPMLETRIVLVVFSFYNLFCLPSRCLEIWYWTICFEFQSSLISWRRFHTMAGYLIGINLLQTPFIFVVRSDLWNVTFYKKFYKGQIKRNHG